MSTLLGYLMPNPLYTYIKYMISKHILIIFSKEPVFILFGQFQELLYNSRNLTSAICFARVIRWYFHF